jgi:hypothetical protein
MRNVACRFSKVHTAPWNCSPNNLLAVLETSEWDKKDCFQSYVQ